MKYLSHDGFGRFSVIRKSVHVGELTGPTCAWCGGAGRHISNDERVLYRYGVEYDDNTRLHFSEKLFCSKSCYNAYCY